MAGYKPYLIANDRTGLELDLDPWLLPGDAYVKLDNFYLFQGRVIKRLGFVPFGSLSTNPVMGLFNYVTTGGSEDLLAFDTKRAYIWDNALKIFTDLAGSDIFTGADNEFFWMSNWLNIGFISNSIDQVYTFNGTTLSTLVIDPGGSGGNTVTGVIMVIPYKDRLIILRPTEGGIRFAQRARWSEIGSYTSWPAANYLDAPTSDWIMGACFIRNELYVFFERSIWNLHYTGDYNQPFIWVRVSASDGTISGMTVVDFENEALALGPIRYVGTDGTDVYNIDDKIPRLILSMNQSMLGYANSVVNEIDDQVWTSYPSLTSPKYSDKILVLNFVDKCWSTFSLAMMCFGYFDRNTDLKWSDLTMPWSDILWRWGDRTIQAGYPQVLGGDVNGNVFVMNEGINDNGADITCELLTGQLNPFIKEGRRCRLGWVDLLVDRQPLAIPTIEFIADSTVYQSVAVPLDDGKGQDKAKVRIYSGVDGDFHQMRITQTGPANIVIHAIIPYAKPAGRMYDG